MIQISTAHAAARLNGTLTFLDTGPAAAEVHLYANTRPASPNDAPGASALVEITLTKPAGTITAGVLTLTPAADGLIATTGTAVWARVINAEGTTAFDADVGQGEGAWEVQLETTQLYAGGDCKLLTATLT